MILSLYCFPIATQCYPTYGELINLLECYPDASSLQKKFHERYPHITISRADRFYNTVLKIAACTKSKRAANEEYLMKIWKPRIRNIPKGKDMH